MEQQCNRMSGSFEPVAAAKMSSSTNVVFHSNGLSCSMADAGTSEMESIMLPDMSAAQFSSLLGGNQSNDYVDTLNLNLSGDYSSSGKMEASNPLNSNSGNLDAAVTSSPESIIISDVAAKQIMSVADFKCSGGLTNDVLLVSESTVAQCNSSCDTLRTVRVDAKHSASPVGLTALLSCSTSTLPASKGTNSCNNCTMPGRSWTPDSDSWDSGFSDCSMPCNYQVPLMQEVCMQNGSAMSTNYGSEKLLDLKTVNDSVVCGAEPDAVVSPDFMFWNESLPSIATNTANDVFSVSPVPDYGKEFGSSSASSSLFSSSSSFFTSDVNLNAKECRCELFGCSKMSLANSRADYTLTGAERYYEDSNSSLMEVFSRTSSESMVTGISISDGENHDVLTAVSNNLSSFDAVQDMTFQQSEQWNSFHRFTIESSPEVGSKSMAKAITLSSSSDSNYQFCVDQETLNSPLCRENCGQELDSVQSACSGLGTDQFSLTGDTAVVSIDNSTTTSAISNGGCPSSATVPLTDLQQICSDELNNSLASSPCSFSSSSEILPEMQKILSSSPALLSIHSDKAPQTTDRRFRLVDSCSDDPPITTSPLAVSAAVITEVHSKTAAPECLLIPSLEMTVILPSSSVGNDKTSTSVNAAGYRQNLAGGRRGDGSAYAVSGAPRPIFRCNACSKTFLLKKYLRRHERMQHQNGKVNCVARRAADDARLKSPTATAPYLDCPLCPKSFVSMKLLKQHVSFHARADSL
ncbi:unnamed protein product [Soboliphyme baturini]|uniref:C2H2-type domain-containing protein n=1 Tax=Soboliphyme baturini TaxID=241478 RepID=A0A183I8V2_9BILA|nr:unnamed protein product [Soboliphyme baturini]